MNQQQIIQANITLLKKVNDLEERLERLEKRQVKPDPTANMYTYEDLSLLSGKSIRSVKMWEKDSGIKTKYPAAKRRFTKQQLEQFLQGL